MITAVVWIVVVAALGWLAMWALQQFSPPDPIGRVARVVIVVACVLIIIGLAAGMFGVDLGMPSPS